MDASPNASSPPVCVLGPLPEKSTYDLKIGLPSRMKSGLLGSRPSAIQATVTPAPVMPWSCAWMACVLVRSSGSSGFDGVPHTPDAALPGAGPGRPRGAARTWLAAGGATLTFWSGTTDATAGLAASVAASAGVTVAANDATALYPITCVPPAAFTCEISGDSAEAGLAGWLFRMTMTGDAACARPAWARPAACAPGRRGAGGGRAGHGAEDRYAGREAGDTLRSSHGSFHRSRHADGAIRRIQLKAQESFKSRHSHKFRADTYINLMTKRNAPGQNHIARIFRIRVPPTACPGRDTKINCADQGDRPRVRG